MSDLFKWVKGRQNTGYKKFTIVYSKFFKFDCYLIAYNKGSFIPVHKDPALNGYKMYRLNIELIKAKKGGLFKCDNVVWSLFNRIFFFRPDIAEHSVTKIDDGFRYVLSFGKLIKKKQS